MALKIRLARLGDKGSPFYRIVVAENRSPSDGKFIEILGTYDPKSNGSDGIKINKETAISWIAKGAVPTDTTKALLVKAGVLTQETKVKKETKTKIKKEKK